MNRERALASITSPQAALHSTKSSHGAMTVSLGFYLGGAALLLLLVAAGALTFRAEYPLLNQHANPTPAGTVPEKVMIVPGSNMYHAGAFCPYAHRDAQPLTQSEAAQRGLVPCPYCLGNSSARLTPVVISRANRR